MKWGKKGLIYAPDGRMPWASHSALTPTPIYVSPDVIRVYAGFRDDEGISRIGFVDVRAQNPGDVLRVSDRPVLDVGPGGAFDDNGLIMGDIAVKDGRWYMYYVGFQLVQKAKFLAFTGLATSDDNGETFTKISAAPVMDRSDEGLYFRAIHSVIFEDGKWKCWYGVGSDWSIINGTPYPKYHTRYIESEDGIHFGRAGSVAIDFVGSEYRIGRPRVSKTETGYRMFYTVGTLNATYMPGYAVSDDGLKWTRRDEEVGIGLSTEGWDSRTLSYATPIRYENKEYLFYNGNDMGRTGFGYAEREI